ncbi:unnamed protein product [Danaus chrysippus]|uniref:(African queen) hypothetical protein n=1 Tax=Danaus chrysippus TaxID=151541 RepID=A0A8J2QHC0_9NEOP|nr:unnamed protein product [Danaus chrysippus]
MHSYIYLMGIFPARDCCRGGIGVVCACAGVRELTEPHDSARAYPNAPTYLCPFATLQVVERGFFLHFPMKCRLSN